MTKNEKRALGKVARSGELVGGYSKYWSALLLCCVLHYGCSHLKEEPAASTVSKPPIVATDFVGMRAAWVVTNGGDLLHTEDGGSSWRSSAGETVGEFDSISFIDELHGWASSRDGRIWRTSDGGDHWVLRSKLNYLDDSFGGPIMKMSFIDDQNGWLICPFALWQTLDGGVRWQRYDVYGSIHEAVADCKFLDTRNALLVDQRGGIHRSQDGGQTWSTEENAPSGIDWGRVYFINDRNVWLSAGDGIYSTSDGGASWKKQRPNELDLLLDSVQLVNSDEIWLTGFQKVRQGPDSRRGNSDREVGNAEAEYENICLHSVNAGQSWETIVLPHRRATSIEVHFDGAQHGWLLVQAVDSTTLYHSTDGGTSWTESLSMK